LEHPAGRKLQASDVELKGYSRSLDRMVQQPNEPSTNDGDVATINCKQTAQKLVASAKRQSKMLAMNALLSAVSLYRYFRYLVVPLFGTVTVPSPNPAKCILVLELFDSIERLQATDACMDDIRLIQKATEAKAMDGARKLAKRQGSDSRTRQQMHLSGLRCEIKWPSGT
jgi:hypothetical protein